MPGTRSRTLITLLAASALSLAAACEPAPPVPPAPSPPTITATTTTTPATGGPVTSPTTTTPAGAPAGGVTATPYALHTDGLRQLWVDPVRGDDSHDGHDRGAALRTITAAWELIPRGTTTQGYRIALTAGSYATDDMPNYWDERTGTPTTPIVIESVDGPGAATTGNMNVFDVDNLAVLGVHLRSPNDLFHCEQCDNLLLRGVTLEGVGDIEAGEGPQETLKVNQSAAVYVEDSDLSGATDNALDMVAVRGGHITGNRIHRAIDWCAYTKGGSADIAVEGNEIYDCGTGGYTAGQGTGLQFMQTPDTTYEARNIRFVNNVIHDTEGAAFGAAGAYGVLFAYNTAYRVGSRSQLVDIVLGRRGCDGAPDDRDAVARCQALLDDGAWGTDGEELEIIPARSIWVFDNVFVNPVGQGSGSQLFQVHDCQPVPADSNIGSPACVDDDLRIEGNVIGNGDADVPVGPEGALADRIAGANTIDVFVPELVDPGHGDFRPVPGSRLAQAHAVAIPEMTSSPAGRAGSGGHPAPAVTTDRAGHPRTAGGPPGAYAG